MVIILSNLPNSYNLLSDSQELSFPISQALNLNEGKTDSAETSEKDVMVRKRKKKEEKKNAVKSNQVKMVFF